MRSVLDIINECDSFNDADLANCVPFVIDSIQVGLILPCIEPFLDSSPVFTKENGVYSISSQYSSVESRSRCLAELFQNWRETKQFKVLEGWRDELYPCYGCNGEIVFYIERSAVCILGITTFGVHCTAYIPPMVKEPFQKVVEGRVWVPRRSYTKQTYPGMLDNTVAGGISGGLGPMETLVKESMEEAGLEEKLIRRNVVSAGVVSYFHVRGSTAGGETGLLQPEVQFVYDLPVDETVMPTVNDNEVHGFELWTYTEALNAARRGEFKPNCALVLVDFMVRHGVITAENDSDYVDIVQRMHRKLGFGMPKYKS